MKLIKTLLLITVLILAGAVITGLFMNPAWQVERQAVVTAPVKAVYGYISKLPNWSQWTAWNKEAYPDMQLTYSGPEVGVGARQSWNDGAMSGYLEVTTVDAGKSLDYLVSMEDGKHSMDCRLAVAPMDAATVVSWLCRGDSGGNPLDRLMMAAYKPMIGRDFEIGLARLQQHFQAVSQ